MPVIPRAYVNIPTTTSILLQCHRVQSGDFQSQTGIQVHKWGLPRMETGDLGGSFHGTFHVESESHLLLACVQESLLEITLTTRTVVIKLAMVIFVITLAGPGYHE